MKTFALIFILCALVVFPHSSACAEDLELFAFITPDSTSDQGYLSLRITNRSDNEVTVLTENFTSYSLGGELITGSGNYRIPDVFLSFEIITMGTREKPEEWKFIPSLPKLGPVTLRKSETATSGIKLDAEFMQALGAEGQKISIRYKIGEDLAKRHGLWQGEIKIVKSADELLQRNVSSQANTSKSGSNREKQE